MSGENWINVRLHDLQDKEPKESIRFQWVEGTSQWRVSYWASHQKMMEIIVDESQLSALDNRKRIETIEVNREIL